MTGHPAQFITLMAVFGLMAVVPGPDFAMVVRQSVTRGRRAGLFTAFGIGTAILFHAAYTIAGLGWVVAHSLPAFTALKVAGAAYLVFIGLKTWRSAPPDTRALETSAPSARGDGGSLALGFLTNALNPKAVLFFLAIFSTQVAPDTAIWEQGVYGLAMAGLLVAWFCLVAVFFTGRGVQGALLACGAWFNRITGGMLVALGLRLALQQWRAAA